MLGDNAESRTFHFVASLYTCVVLGKALSTSPSVCTNGSYLHVSTTDYWGLARQGESGNGEDCALVAELAKEVW